MTTLRSKLIRLAHSEPEFRKPVLALLKNSADLTLSPKRVALGKRAVALAGLIKSLEETRPKPPTMDANAIWGVLVRGNGALQHTSGYLLNTHFTKLDFPVKPMRLRGPKAFRKHFVNVAKQAEDLRDDIGRLVNDDVGDTEGLDKALGEAKKAARVLGNLRRL